jgi:hypothetical protein
MEADLLGRAVRFTITAHQGAEPLPDLGLFPTRLHGGAERGGDFFYRRLDTHGRHRGGGRSCGSSGDNVTIEPEATTASRRLCFRMCHVQEYAR